jgi:trimethylamine--corrinoid protein Co-methyltransferase
MVRTDNTAIGTYWQLLDEESYRRIDTAAVDLLSRCGCRVEHEELLGMLEGAGCRVDRPAMRAYVPEKLVRDVVSAVGGKTEETVRAAGAWNPQQRLWQSGSYPHLLEWPSGERRLATSEDVVTMAKMGHALDEVADVGRVLCASDVDPRVEPVWTTLAVASTTDKKIIGGEVFHADYLEPLMRMGEVLSGKAGDTSLIASCDFFVAPLILERQQAELFVTKRRLGIENCPGTMPISGMSSPVTIAGTMTVAVAELMMGWVLGYLLDPALPASGLVASGSLDMRTSNACFGSPEALLQDVATSALCRRLYGIAVGPVSGYVDCKRPGFDAAYQKLFPLVASPYGAPRGISTTGLLSAGQDYSPVQHLIDAEVQQSLERFNAGFTVSDDTIAAGLIEEMVRADSTNFLAADHTMEHFRSEQWYPRWLQRTPWQGTETEVAAEDAMFARIDRYIYDAVAEYEAPSIDRTVLNELKAVFVTAEKKLLGANVSPLPLA